MNVKISVIIPIYNTERILLERCVQSIIMQRYKNIEILLIDDGSVSKTAETIDELGQYDKRIKVFHLENRGASSARNFGIKHSTGEYFTFVDSDDYISESMIWHAFQIISETDADLVVGAVKRVFSRSNVCSVSKKKVDYKKLSSDDIEAMKGHMLDMSVKQYQNIDGGNITRGPIARFVKKKTMGVIFFDEELVVGEDTVWNIKLLDQGGNIVVAYEQWYFYAQNEASVTHKYDENMKEYIADKLYAVQKLVEIHPELQKNYNALMVEEITSRLIKSFLLHNDNVMSYREKKMYLKNFLKENPFKEIYQFHVRFNKTGIKLLFIKLDLILPLYIVWRNIKHEN